MYAGHAAIATYAKGKRPRLPMALLVPVAFAPDWIAWILRIFHNENRELSHSLVSVGIGATIVALVYWLVTRAVNEALALWATYASHWPADFITGFKPTVPGGRYVGMMLYNHAWADFLVESILVILCWLVYRASLPAASRRRWFVYLIPVGLIALQTVFERIQGNSFP